MRKQISVAVLLALAAMAALGETAKLTEPKAGDFLTLGTTVPVSWNASGAAKIKLVLFRANVGKVGIIRSGLQLAAAFHFWKVGALENGKAAPAGNDYLVRIVRSADNAVLDVGPTFSIVEPAQPSPPALVVMSPTLQMANVPAPPPASASFAIKKVSYEYEAPGKLRFVDVLVSVSSPQAFAISPAYGDPQYGAQWISYEIDNPVPQPGIGVWIAATFSGVFSVKGGGASQAFSRYPTAPVPAGNREYILSFKPQYNGLAKGCGSFQKMPNGLCRQEFYPRMKIHLTAHTAQGAVKSSAIVYLVYDTKIWPLNWISFPGETNLCSGGVQSW
jgi:hypothetical protein